MTIKPLGTHYAMENPASIYDEEAMTALELAGRTTAKVNEVVEDHNAIRTEWETEKTVNIPKTVEESVQGHIDNGDFAKQIDQSLGNLESTTTTGFNNFTQTVGAEVDLLEARLNTLLGSVGEGTSTLDAEIIDLRTDPDGYSHLSAGEMVRSYLKGYVNFIEGDLNTVMKQCRGVVADAPNAPTPGIYMLDVDWYNTNTKENPWVVQRMTALNTGRLYYRWYRSVGSAPTWSNWTMVNKHSEQITILDTDDMNGYNTGNYHGVVVAGCANTPENDSAIVEIETISSGSPYRVIQKWYSLGTGRVYYRHLINTTWSGWKLIGPNASLLVDVGDDLNAVTDGPYHGVVVAGALNTPENGSGFINIEKYDSTSTHWIMQTWYGLDSGSVFYRTYRAGVWSAWHRINQNGVSAHPMADKTVVFLGDSIFGFNQSANGIPARFAEYTGANVYNLGFGGTRAKARGTSGWAMFDGENLVNAIVAGNIDALDEALDIMEPDGGVPEYFRNTVSLMRTIDFTKVDYVICNYGTNDWTAPNTVSQYTQAMRNIITTLLNAFPNMVFIKCTPAERFIVEDGVFKPGSSYKQSTGNTLRDFVNADKTAYEEYNIPIVDMMTMGVNVYNLGVHFTASDYTHPAGRGCIRFAQHIARNV